MPRASDAARGSAAAAAGAADAPAYGTFPGAAAGAAPAPDGPVKAEKSEKSETSEKGERGGDQDAEAEELPFMHPASKQTPLWRKLGFEFFSRQSLKEQLESGQIWHLPRKLTSARASAHFSGFYSPGKPTSSCMSLKAAIFFAHWKPLVLCWFLELGSLVFGLSTPILFFVVIQTAVDGSYRLLDIAVMLVLLYASTLMEIIMHCHSRFIGFMVNVKITGALRTLLFETTLGNSSRAESSPSSLEERNGGGGAPQDSNHHSHDIKKRIAEVAHMYAHDVVLVAQMTTHMPVVWRVFMKVAAELYILVQVIGISAKPIFIALTVFSLGLKMGSQFASKVRKKLMRTVEERLNVIHECFKSMQMIKLNAWEEKMINKIDGAREKENMLRKGVNVITALKYCLSVDSPNLASIVIFAWMAMQDEDFSPAQVFPALLLFRRIKDDLHSIVHLLDLTTNGHTSLKKLSAYFNDCPRLLGPWGTGECWFRAKKVAQMEQIEKRAEASDTIVAMRQACFAPAADTSKPLLFNINMLLPKGSLAVIHGKAGAGKSTLLNAILGNVESVYGDVFVRDTCKIAYCAQEAWLQTQSIRDNVLFGSEFDERKYQCVLEACCLIEDLLNFPDGDATKVGPKGINLSGGQKARIALARACYADADLYLLDCPFASVDPIVQNEIFNKCIVELLRYKTVVLVTHNPELSSSDFVDQLFKVENMGIQVEQRRVADRRQQEKNGGKRVSRRTDQANSLPPWRHKTAISESKQAEENQMTGLCLWDPTSSLTPESESEDIGITSGKALVITKKELEACKSATYFMCTLDPHPDQPPPKLEFKFFTREKMLSVFNGKTMKYMIPGKVFLVLYAIVSTAKDIWLMSWSASSEPTRFEMLHAVNIYVMLVISSALFGMLSTILHTKALSITSNELFHDMTVALVRAPMAFFYRTPVGEIFSRYFNDMHVADTQFVTSFLSVFRSAITIIASDLMVWYYTGFAGMGILVIFFIAIKQFVGLGYGAALLQRAFQTEAANLNLISEALDGSATIRAFGSKQVARFCAQHGVISDELLRGRYHGEAFKCFVLVRCDRALGLHLIIVLVLLSTHKIAAAELGLLLYYVFTINSDVFTLTLELLQSIRYRFNIDRIVEYTRIQPEEIPLSPEQEQESQALPSPANRKNVSKTWPTKGDVVFESVWFAYESDAARCPGYKSQGALALQDVSFSVKGGEKIGVVGRTGSGKSSLAMAMFRVHQLQRGRILIDGVDVSSLRLHKLRHNVCVLPQTPLFYRCSVRAYLDPFEEHEDDELWHVLTLCGLEGSVRTLEGEMLADNGENWSAGERQMLCLARAALSPSRVVILDESFSAVDQAGQSQLVSVLDTVFANSTIFLITHRLEEILGFDRILVMRDGRAVEFGNVDELAANPDSAFYEFLETTLLTM